MRKVLLTSLALTMALSGCSGVRESNLNPFNWFGRSTSQRVVAEPQETEVNPLIPKRRRFIDAPPPPPYAGSLVQEVTELHIRKTVTGAVIEAKGVFRSVGSYDVRLIAQEDNDPTTLTYEFRALQPRATQGLGSRRARTVTAAIEVTNQDLLGVRAIKVIAQGNVRTARR